MEAKKKTLLWIDCDMEYDDAMAIILAAYTPTMKILGISSVVGVVSALKSATYALQILELAGIDGIDVVRGCEDGIIRPARIWKEFDGKHAIEWAGTPEAKTKKLLEKNPILHMYEVINAQTEKVTIVGIAQYTNIALLLKTFPEIKAKIDQIVLMGGAISVGNVNAAAEFNCEGDPEASKIVLESGLKIVMIPLDVTRKIIVTDEILKELKAMNTEFGEITIKLLTFFKTVYAREFTNVHDVATVAYLIQPDLLKLQLMNVEIERGSTCSDGRTNCDLYGRSKKAKNVHLALDVKVEALWKLLMNALAQANSNWKKRHSGKAT